MRVKLNRLSRDRRERFRAVSVFRLDVGSLLFELEPARDFFALKFERFELIVDRAVPRQERQIRDVLLIADSVDYED